MGPAHVVDRVLASFFLFWLSGECVLRAILFCFLRGFFFLSHCFTFLFFVEFFSSSFLIEAQWILDIFDFKGLGFISSFWLHSSGSTFWFNI